MAQGSTGFSKQEIDALMDVIGHPNDWPQGHSHEWELAIMRAYRKLQGVQKRLS